MSIVRTDLRETRERARELRYEPSGAITQHDVQKAIEQVSTQPQAITGTSVVFASSPYTVLSTDSMLYVDSSGGAVTILLQAASARLGVPISIKDVGGAAAANPITITPNGAETIDLMATLLIDSNYGGYRLNPRTLSYTLAP